MKTISTTRVIEASHERVFETIAHVKNFSKAVPSIVQIEFLSEQELGVGTRFRETREMNGKAHSVDLEVTEYLENESIRIVSEAGGTIWDTVFTVLPKGSATELKMVMEAKPKNLMAKMALPMIFGMVQTGVESDMDAVKAYCETP